MKKKSFYTGIIIGVISSTIAFGGLNVVAMAVGNKTQKEFTVTDKLNYIGQLLDKYYVEDIDMDKVAEGAYYGMADSLGDPYTTYLSADQLKSFMEDIDGEFYGIGVSVLTNYDTGSIIVVKPIAGTPAEQAGILANDEITAVDDVSVKDMDISEVVSKIKGVEGTSVKITVFRPSKDEELSFDIKRSNIEVETVGGKMFADNIAYISISGFKNNTYEQFAKTYDKLISEGAKGMIIDVRNNPGGSFDVVNKIADRLIPEGDIVYTIDKAGERIDYKSDAERINIPLCILVNGSSASASEILAGAVQDSETGKLVGTQTFGKGLVQTTYPIPDGSAIKVTIKKYYTPRGVCIQGEGIKPDYIIDFPEDVGTVIYEENDVQLHKAIEVIKGQFK